MGTNGGFTARSSWTKETQDERDAGKRPLRERQKPSLCKHTTADFRIAVFLYAQSPRFLYACRPDFLVCPTPLNGVGHCFVNKGIISGSIGSSPSHKNRAHRRAAAVGAGGCVNEMIFGGFAAWHIAVYVGFLQIKTCILLKTYILRGDSLPTAYTLNLFK